MNLRENEEFEEFMDWHLNLVLAKVFQQQMIW